MGGTDAGAGAALDAVAVITADDGGNRLYFDAVILQKLEGLFDIASVAGKLKDHEAVIAGQDGGLKYVEVNIILLDQLTDNRLIAGLLGKMQDIYFGVHGFVCM